ncbi:serine hydrolase domain-containing protein [Mangrovibacterium sp.]|uniref:serine hydrolase domain-containing protein n=1 Tax=Mangrovibacterium sp. TaxID=1961364 RepID=UPI003566F314
MKLKFLPLKSILPFVLIFFSFYSCNNRKSDSRVVLDRDYKDEIIAGRDALRLYLITGAPGASVSVSIDGKTVWSEGMGYANKELHVPARPETKYRIGRSSEVFATMLVAKLQEEGKVNVDSSFYTYVPNYPKKQWDFTLRNLGNHTAGFPQTSNDIVYNKENYKTLKEYVHASADDSLAFPPNNYYAISDYGTCLLGILAETVEGKSYPILVKEMLLDTMGLNETVADNPVFVIPDRSATYTTNYIAQVANAPGIDSRFVAPAYGYLSTADDLNKLGQMIMNKEFFTEETYNLILTPNNLKTGYHTNIGFGWSIFNDKKGNKVYILQGNTIGGTSFLAVFPDKKLVISLCSNMADNSDGLPSTQIVNLFLNKLDPEKPKSEVSTKETEAEQKQK